jgi:hypothetical protein
MHSLNDTAWLPDYDYFAATPFRRTSSNALAILH